MTYLKPDSLDLSIEIIVKCSYGFFIIIHQFYVTPYNTSCTHITTNRITKKHTK